MLSSTSLLEFTMDIYKGLFIGVLVCRLNRFLTVMYIFENQNLVIERIKGRNNLLMI